MLKKIDKSIKKCTACSAGNRSELLHPVLKVPICGACNHNIKNADVSISDKNQVSCTWCGCGDGEELFMCDTCNKSFCTICVERNLGIQVAKVVRDQFFWSCYACDPEMIKELQINDDVEYYNIEHAYEIVHPPDITKIIEDYENKLDLLSLEERQFVSLFTGNIGNKLIKEDLIIQYLCAYDLSATYQLSKRLRMFFIEELLILPGLFRTSYGKENHCKLHKHQIISLKQMMKFENQTNEFGLLRGGILADEPGLGKTVTTLALITTSAGKNPQQPSIFWDKTSLESNWNIMKGQYHVRLQPILNKLNKQTDSNPFGIQGIMNIMKNIEYYCINIGSFESAVKSAIKSEVPKYRDRYKLLDLFRNEMNNLKFNLDRNNRKLNHISSNHQQIHRIKYERKLCPSSSTLIIVPLTLLEHWYEQISTHLNLKYFSRDEDMRGVVYLDGLGDIMDVSTPLSNVAVTPNSKIQSASFLSSYLIVITTFERCIEEYKHYKASGTSDNIALLQIRWLRLLVDEGHELGQASINNANSNTTNKANSINNSNNNSNNKYKQSMIEENLLTSTKFISLIASERRWIVSGTPTTGTSSELALIQIHRLLLFLRHPKVFTSNFNQLLVDFNNKSMNINKLIYQKIQNNNEEFLTCNEWYKLVVAPCLQQDIKAWNEVIHILSSILLRHTKRDIELYPPIHNTINLDAVFDPSDKDLELQQQKIRSIDRAKAYYIRDMILQAKREYKQYSRYSLGNRYSLSSINSIINHNHRLSSNHLTTGSPKLDLNNNDREILSKSRRPKAIVFSQYENDLQGTAHFLYTILGDSSICEHFGRYQSTELSRFRHSRRKYRECPLCGFKNQLSHGKSCDQDLILIEYVNVVPPIEVYDEEKDNDMSNISSMIEPQPGGHGSYGPGGHYIGKCLCSPTGCTNIEYCKGLPNLFYHQELVNNPNFAIIRREDILGYQIGDNIDIGQNIHVSSCTNSNGNSNSSSNSSNCSMERIDYPKPKLWQGGRMGGAAVIKYWRKCGGMQHYSWHGDRILHSIPWHTEVEDASILLLKEDGSTGLDLSFATHIFLLERIHNPALRNQIISRAHRMGATGPVHVILLQVKSEYDSDNDK